MFKSQRTNKSPRRRLSWLQTIGIGLAVLGITLVVVPSALAAIVIPMVNGAVYIQTTGPLAEVGIGDYRTNDPVSVSSEPDRDPAGAGDNQPHRMELIIPCQPNAEYTIELFDPAIDLGTEAVDEPRDDNNDDTDNLDWFDNTTFRLYSPGGAMLQETTYTPNTSNDAWTLFANISLSSSPVAGGSCGSYVLETETGNQDPYSTGLNNDDNAWQMRLNGVGFEAELGPDGIGGSGDQAQVGVLAISYQQVATACQDFYWFVDDGDTNLYMLNFDLDDQESYGEAQVCYFAPGVSGDCSGGYPGGPVVDGSRSGNSRWNNSTDQTTQSYIRPAYSDMATFDGTSDFTGDAIANPTPGLWRAQLCVDANNQYSFEVPNHLVFLTPPRLPDMSINKDDGVEIVNSPGTTTYDLTITNNGLAAAMPLPGNEPELVDQLPSGMTYQSCAVNAPLIGTCSENPAGSGRVEFQFTGNTVYNTGVFLPGRENTGQNTATVTITANVDAGLAGGTQLENIATLDYSDAFNNNFPPVSDNDIDTVVGEGPLADLSLTKTVNVTNASAGDTVNYTLELTNSGPDATSNVTVTDNLLTTSSSVYSNVSVVNVSQGSYDTATGLWTVGDMAVNQMVSATISATLAVDPPVTNIVEVTTSDVPDPDSTPNNGAPGEDDYATATINPPGVTPEPTPTEAAPSVAVNTTGPTLVKSATPQNALIGETVFWTIQVANTTDTATGNIIITDTVPAAFSVTRVTSTRGTVSVTGNSFTVNIGVLQPGEEAVISVESVADVLAAPPQTCNQAFAGSTASNEVCVVIFPAELPATGGGAPPNSLMLLRWLAGIAGAGILLAVAGWAFTRSTAQTSGK